MKNRLRWTIIALFSLLTGSSNAQTNNEPESLGLPGDNLNLYAVLKVFQESKTHT